MKIDVIIPVCRPTEKFDKLLWMIMRQTCLPQHIIILHTRDGVELDYSRYEDRVPIMEIDIPENRFDHGGTRDFGIQMSDAEVVILMTQDAVPVNEKLFEKLSRTIKQNPDVAVVYARQISDERSGVLEAYTRVFNYPGKSQIKSKKDLAEMGIKTYFCSNVCAAYQRQIYLKLGGFESPVIFNEDLLFAAKAIKNEWKIAYEAEAEVKHSHHYTCRQLLKRNFDQGVSQRCHPEVFAGVSSEKEGLRLIVTVLKRLVKERRYLQILRLTVESISKYAGYQLGKHYERLPDSLIKQLTMNRNYWKERSEKNV